MKLSACPECGEILEHGFVNAPSVGILWFKDKNPGWVGLFSRKFEKLQKDWWGPKLMKENIPAVRCQKCKFVAFDCSAK